MPKEILVTIPIDEIHILNYRERNRAIAEEIEDNIDSVGLKRPITVMLSHSPETGKKYDLICGQGRLEAFIKAGEREIPARLRVATKEEALLMSLIENICRRKNSPLELIQCIRNLEEAGDTAEDISRKTNLSKDYVSGILKLLEKGEQYLVNAVEGGRIPINLAVSIASGSEGDGQLILAKACEANDISEHDLRRMKEIVAVRMRRGRRMKAPREKRTRIGAQKLMQEFKKSAKEKKFLIAQSEHYKSELMYVTSAFRDLFQNVHYVNQLKAARLEDIPACIVKKLGGPNHGNQG